MARGLQSLIKIHEWKVTEEQRKLAEVNRAIEDMESRIARLDTDLAHEQAVAASDPHQAGRYLASYTAAALERRRRLVQSLATLEEQAAGVRADLHEAYRERRKYELAEEARQRREAEDRERREQMDLDELGTQGVARRGK
ncbi:MAG: flagellar FliJ family protein [Hyphomicrobiales bacterium]|nr:flagellar FliJ family protein [Hyphomicrobiales bacterium]MCP5372600.1 flagellar FliJ family protein [Hyphomicrobiales bacterium]